MVGLGILIPGTFGRCMPWPLPSGTRPEPWTGSPAGVRGFCGVLGLNAVPGPSALPGTGAWSGGAAVAGTPDAAGVAGIPEVSVVTVAARAAAGAGAGSHATRHPRKSSAAGGRVVGLKGFG